MWHFLFNLPHPFEGLYVIAAAALPYVLYAVMWTLARGFYDGKYSSVERFANRTRNKVRKAREVPGEEGPR